MTNVIDWTAFQQRVDYIVDNTFGEPVILIPWLADTKIYTPAEQGPDKTRKAVVTTGMFVTPGAKLIGESGRATGGSGGGFGTQMLEQEVWLSVTMLNIGDVINWKSGDKVYFNKRDRFYNISYVEDSATLRPNFHLIREHDITTGEGSPLGQNTPATVNAMFFDTLGNKFYKSAGLTVNDWVVV